MGGNMKKMTRKEFEKWIDTKEYQISLVPWIVNLAYKSYCKGWRESNKLHNRRGTVRQDKVIVDNYVKELEAQVEKMKKAIAIRDRIME